MNIVLFAAVSGLALVASSADAAVNIYVSQSGSDVFAQTIGSLDLTGLVFARNGTSTSTIKGDPGFIFTGAANQLAIGYTGFTGPDHFGDTLFSYASSGVGDAFGFTLGNGIFYVPDGYTSGKAIVSSATYAGKTLADLELTVGDYVFTSAHDTVTLHIGEAAPAAVPEPASWALMLGGFGAIGGVMRARRKIAVRFS
jgi:hypothetical protein